MFAAVKGAVLDGRAAAEVASLRRTESQLLAALGRGVDVSVGRSLGTVHQLAAERAGHGVVSRWLTSQLDPTKPWAPARQFELVASTEAVDSFTRTRNDALGRLSPTVAADLWKVWQTAGDRRVCDRCSSLESKAVRIYQDFPRGDPPIHGSCRCSFTLFRTDELLS